MSVSIRIRPKSAAALLLLGLLVVELAGRHLHGDEYVLLPVLHRGQRDLLEGRLHALPVLGTGGHVLDFRVLRQELLHRGLLDFPLLLPIDLVAHQNEGEFFGLLGRPLVEELSDPALDVVEGSLIGDVVHQHAAVCTSVEGAAETTKLFLACCIPYLKIDDFAIDDDLLLHEIGADGGLIGL